MWKTGNIIAGGLILIGAGLLYKKYKASADSSPPNVVSPQPYSSPSSQSSSAPGNVDTAVQSAVAGTNQLFDATLELLG